MEVREEHHPKNADPVYSYISCGHYDKNDDNDGGFLFMPSPCGATKRTPSPLFNSAARDGIFPSIFMEQYRS